jgi:hypothetical protein
MIGRVAGRSSSGGPPPRGEVVLAGDRPAGPLHLGHSAGIDPERTTIALGASGGRHHRFSGDARATTLAHGPSAAHAVTKRCLHEEWSMDVDSAIDFEAGRQAKCMRGGEFERAYRAFVENRTPVFEGN